MDAFTLLVIAGATWFVASRGRQRPQGTIEPGRELVEYSGEAQRAAQAAGAALRASGVSPVSVVSIVAHRWGNSCEAFAPKEPGIYCPAIYAPVDGYTVTLDGAGQSYTYNVSADGRKVARRQMGWPLRLVEYRQGANLESGDCFYLPREEVRLLTADGQDPRWRVWGYELSDEYVAERMGVRPPVAVQLPCGDVFVVDAAVSGERRGWQVTGEPPGLTVHPSIHLEGIYHGWITDGQLSDDVDGRQFHRVPRPDGVGFWWRRRPQVDAQNFVAPNAYGTWDVYVGGRQVGPFSTQREAEQAYDAQRGRGAPTAPPLASQGIGKPCTEPLSAHEQGLVGGYWVCRDGFWQHDSSARLGDSHDAGHFPNAPGGVPHGNPTAQPLPPAPCTLGVRELVRASYGPTAPHVYLWDGAELRHVPDEATLRANGWTQDQVRLVDPECLARQRVGAPLARSGGLPAQALVVGGAVLLGLALVR